MLAGRFYGRVGRPGRPLGVNVFPQRRREKKLEHGYIFRYASKMKEMTKNLIVTMCFGGAVGYIAGVLVWEYFYAVGVRHISDENYYLYDGFSSYVGLLHGVGMGAILSLFSKYPLLPIFFAYKILLLLYIFGLLPQIDWQRGLIVYFVSVWICGAFLTLLQEKYAEERWSIKDAE